MKFLHYPPIALLLLPLLWMVAACSSDAPQWRVGVSQCCVDEWRTRMNTEMQREAAVLGTMELIFRSADNDSRQQCTDIDSFISEDVDLLIVSPNEAHGVTPAIRRARAAGIPVVLVDRNIDTQDYDVFVGADNYDIGYKAGLAVVSTLRGKGYVLELSGLMGSTTAEERHRGFISALTTAPDIHVLETLDARYQYDAATQIVDSLIRLKQQPAPDLVFAHNDQMAAGARDAFERNGVPMPLFVGVDALFGKEHGLNLVLSGKLRASVLYPPGGDTAIQVADSILRHLQVRDYHAINVALVDSTNAHVLDIQMQQLAKDAGKIATLNQRISTLGKIYVRQRYILGASIAILMLIIVIVLLVYRAYRVKQRSARELEEKNSQLEQQKNRLEEQARTLEEHKLTLEEQQTRLLEQRTQLALLTERLEQAEDETFTSQIREIIANHLSDMDFSVGQLAAEACLSRTQLFRKVKDTFGCTPVVLIRIARLKRAAELLKKTERTVAEVSYACGFSSPSYFTKCYKEYFDVAPRSFKKSIDALEDISITTVAPSSADSDKASTNTPDEEGVADEAEGT